MGRTTSEMNFWLHCPRVAFCFDGADCVCSHVHILNAVFFCCCVLPLAAHVFARALVLVAASVAFYLIAWFIRLPMDYSIILNCSISILTSIRQTCGRCMRVFQNLQCSRRFSFRVPRAFVFLSLNALFIVNFVFPSMLHFVPLCLILNDVVGLTLASCT